MTTILHNLQGIVTPADTVGWELNIQAGVALALEDGRIRAIDTPEKLQEMFADARRIDGAGCWALPGFVDPHTHPVFFKTREGEFSLRVMGKSYEEIAAAGGGIRNSVRVFRQASFDELSELTYQRIRRFLEYGTTTIEAK
ncbi:MAG: imidazolonepropionase, partial [Calditrichaeota bacterium]|nr:imidazolonepropionase [Calditrichota bacterium]